MDRYDQTRITVLRLHNALNAVEATADDSNPLPDIQEGIRAKGNFFGYDQLDRSNLFLRNGSAQTTHTDKANDTPRSQNRDTLMEVIAHSGEYVSRKQRYLDSMSAIAPRVPFRKKRKKGMNRAFLQFSVNPLLMARAGLQRIPCEIIRGCYSGLRRYLKGTRLHRFEHGSAILSPTQDSLPGLGLRTANSTTQQFPAID